MASKMSKIILPKTREEAIFITKNYDNSESIREFFELRKNIKKRSYCRFFKICKGFYLASETCVHGGGEYCGHFRKLSHVENKIIKKRKLKKRRIKNGKNNKSKL